MNGEHWKTAFNIGSTGRERRPVTALPLPEPPSNNFRSDLQRIHAIAFPEQPFVPSVPAFDLGYVAPFSTDTAKQDEPVELSAEPEPPLLQPPMRDLAEEVSQLVSPVGDYVAAFTITEPVDTFELAYSAPLSTAKPQSATNAEEEKKIKDRKAALLDGLQTWADSLCQFLEDHRAWHTTELQQQHAVAWQQAREQIAAVNLIRERHLSGVRRLFELRQELGKAKLAFDGHDGAKPDLAALPSQSDIDKWLQENEALRSALQRADEAVTACLDSQSGLRLRFERERAKLNALKKTEADLRARLSGEEMTDRETGLLRPPEI